MSVSPPPGPELVGIAAVARNGVIGADGDIPWRIPADWQRFKRLTLGHTLVMGRRTYDSIGRPLPGRTTVVVTRDKRWRGDDVLVAPSVPEALALAAAHERDTVFVAGGGEIYRQAWDALDRLEVTEVDAEPDGSVYFPPVQPDRWLEVSRDPHEGYAFVTYRRR